LFFDKKIKILTKKRILVLFGKSCEPKSRYRIIDIRKNKEKLGFSGTSCWKMDFMLLVIISVVVISTKFDFFLLIYSKTYEIFWTDEKLILSNSLGCIQFMALGYNHCVCHVKKEIIYVPLVKIKIWACNLSHLYIV
jgi:hypothetical protein